MVEKKRPIRTCIACRSFGEKKGLLRVVRSASGEIEIDSSGKKPGRGAYICHSSQCVELAIKKKAFERALRTAVPKKLLEELKKAVQENGNANH